MQTENVSCEGPGLRLHGAGQKTRATTLQRTTTKAVRQSDAILFYFLLYAVWRTLCPCPCLPIWAVLHCLYGCLSCPTRIICDCPMYFSLLFISYFLVFPPESLPGDDVLNRLLSRPLPSVCFLPCLFVLFIFLRPYSLPVCFGVTSFIL